MVSAEATGMFFQYMLVLICLLVFLVVGVGAALYFLIKHIEQREHDRWVSEYKRIAALHGCFLDGDDEEPFNISSIPMKALLDRLDKDRRRRRYK